MSRAAPFTAQGSGGVAQLQGLHQEAGGLAAPGERQLHGSGDVEVRHEQGEDLVHRRGRVRRRPGGGVESLEDRRRRR